MTNGEARTLLSVRGEAVQTVPPDAAVLGCAISAVRQSRAMAMDAVNAPLATLIAELGSLGGSPQSAEAARAHLTWLAHSLSFHEEYGTSPSGEHAPNGKHRGTVQLTVTVRDFGMLQPVLAAATAHNADVNAVNWVVDDDNPGWAQVRADAIQAALLKGQDYAAALGGAVVSVEHVADAGLLGGEGAAANRWVNAMAMSGGGMGVSLDPAPQQLTATIDARFIASIGPLPRSVRP